MGSANMTSDEPYLIASGQAKNPVWKHIKPDFIVSEGQQADFILSRSKFMALFVSLIFYYEYPLYLTNKLSMLAKGDEYRQHTNRVLLILYDKKEDVNDYLTEIIIVANSHDFKPLVGFSFKDIGEYLKSFRVVNTKAQYYLKNVNV